MLPGGLIVIGRRGGRRHAGAKLQGTLLHREEQGFGWPWPGMFMALTGAVTFAAVAIPFGLGMWTQLVEHRPWGNRPMPDEVLLAVGPLAILGSLLPLAALFTRLTIEVRTDGIALRLSHLCGGQTLLREDVGEVRPVRLGFLDVGKSQRPGRRVYRLAGSEGVELRKARGGVVVVSSEHPQALLRAVRSMLGAEPRR